MRAESVTFARIRTIHILKPSRPEVNHSLATRDVPGDRGSLAGDRHRPGDGRRGGPASSRADRGWHAAGPGDRVLPRRVAGDGRRHDAARPACLLSTPSRIHGRSARRPRLAIAIFLGASAIVWAGFGLAAFIGDMALHHVVDMTPWLGARPWLIEAGVLAAAGAYQFTPLKRRYLAACRRPGERAKPAWWSGADRISPRSPPRFRLPRQLVGADARHVRRWLREPWCRWRSSPC